MASQTASFMQAIGIGLMVAILVASIVVPICQLNSESNGGSQGLNYDGHAYDLSSIAYTTVIAGGIILLLTGSILSMLDRSDRRGGRGEKGPGGSEISTGQPASETTCVPQFQKH